MARPLQDYWMHNGFLNIDNKKMSKSLGNFFTVREIGEKYDLQVLRFFMLSAHYRSPINFSAELMEASKERSGAYHHLLQTDLNELLSKVHPADALTEEEAGLNKKNVDELESQNSRQLWTMTSIRQMLFPPSLSW